MTNAQIILQEMALHNVTEEVHTFARWKQMGFKVKHGEHAIITTSLWKQSTGKKEEADDSEDGEQSNGRCYLHKAHLFGRSQVEKIEETA